MLMLVIDVEKCVPKRLRRAIYIQLFKIHIFQKHYNKWIGLHFWYNLRVFVNRSFLTHGKKKSQFNFSV
uniref:Uncharacterized protein n=1 Tax=Anguilla anguilla TaxID=7936 RepID=A0A0E9RYF9_ANGAN